MGRTMLVGRLAVRDLRRHVAQALLLLLAVTAATAVLTLGLALSGVTSQPYQQTRAATRGPDVVAYIQSPSTAGRLIHASGVTRYSGPFPLVYGVLKAGGHTAGVEAEGRSQSQAAVDQPKLTAGSWIRPGGVVIERTFAEALRVGVGSRITINGHPFTVAGIAVSAAKPAYPNICYAGGCEPMLNGAAPKNTGLVWATEPDVVAMPVAAAPLNTYVLDLQLSHPDQAAAFASRYGPGPSLAAGAELVPWEQIAAADGLLVADEQAVLTPGAVLLSLLAIASVAVLVGGRIAENNRRVGLLKAAGGTPGLVAATFLAENLVLAVVAAAAGLTIGRLVAPLLTSPGAAMLGTPGAPALTPAAVIEVTGVALIVALASTLAPAIRAARRSTVSSLADSARRPRRHRALVSLSSRLPVFALFGLRLAARRPRRALLSGASVAITVCGIVAVLAFHSTVAAQTRTGSSTGLADPVVSRDEQMLTVITVVLIVLAAISAIFTAWATVLDARRPSAVMRALGADCRQVCRGLVAVQMLSALPGAIVGVPLGIVVFDALSRGAATSPPVPLLAAVVLGTQLAVAGLTAGPAMLATRVPAALVLQAEAV
jgi:putative ABC transport system permease protein